MKFLPSWCTLSIGSQYDCDIASNGTPYSYGVWGLSNHWSELMAGIGQGNGAGPSIWAAVNTLLFAIMHSEEFLLVLTSISLLERILPSWTIQTLQ